MFIPKQMTEGEKASKQTECKMLSHRPIPRKTECLRCFVNTPAEATASRMKQAQEAESPGTFRV